MTTSANQDILRHLPGVDTLLQADAIQAALTRHPRSLILESIRQILNAKRRRILEHPESALEVTIESQHLVALILERLEALSDYALQPVINATGIVIHTNLGRSLLAEEAANRLQTICRSYNNLEYDLERGERGSRYIHAEAVLRELTGSEAALVVNNNAGAVLLVLNTLAAGKEVVVSRGQLVEIGGSFRIPDVMGASGAILREVGCTNRTHRQDYESAINERTAVLMKVHTSNYRIIGFSAEVGIEELSALGRERGIPVVEDLGSGCFLDLSEFGLKGEPTVCEAVRAGADVITFSGDKLLGGPQAGIILGKEEFIARCRKNPLTRALRVDKLTLAALEATLRLYRDERRALAEIPTLRAIAVSSEELQGRARTLANLIRQCDPERRFNVSLRRSYSQVGGGSLPGKNLQTVVVAVYSETMSTQKIEALMRSWKPPVIGRIESDFFLLDVRTIDPSEFQTIRDAFGRVVGLAERDLSDSAEPSGDLSASDEGDGNSD